MTVLGSSQRFPNQPPTKQRAPPSRIGSRTDNLTIRLGQKTNIVLISFRSPSGVRNGCTWRMYSVPSYQWSSPRSFLQSSKEEVMGGRLFLVFCRQTRRSVRHRWRVLACASPRVRDAGSVGASAPLSEKASPLLYPGAEGSSESPKLVRLIGSSSTRTEKKDVLLTFANLLVLKFD